MSHSPRPLRVLFATPAYWPAVAFGGPTWVAKELTEALVRRGHEVDVVTTSLRAIGEPPASRWRTRVETVGGVRVTYLATPARYRWMGITPMVVSRLVGARPDVLHVFGYRDVVTTSAAAWARAARVPYVFEPLDMVLPRYRNVPLKRLFDRLVGRRVIAGAALVVANSRHEASELEDSGVPARRIETRPNGFPAPAESTPGGSLRTRLRLAESTPLVLNVGRITFKKGLDLLLEAAAQIPDAQFAIMGPDDGDGTLARLRTRRQELGLADRVHFVETSGAEGPGGVYGEADVFVLPSRNESFGMVAAEAAAAGTAVVLTDRCGVAELLGGRAALVTRCDAAAVRDAIRKLLDDPELRRRLGEGGLRVAAETTWDAVAERQEALYRLALGS